MSNGWQRHWLVVVVVVVVVLLRRIEGWMTIVFIILILISNGAATLYIHSTQAHVLEKRRHILRHFATRRSRCHQCLSFGNKLKNTRIRFIGIDKLRGNFQFHSITASEVGTHDQRDDRIICPSISKQWFSWSAYFLIQSWWIIQLKQERFVQGEMNL